MANLQATIAEKEQDLQKGKQQLQGLRLRLKSVQEQKDAQTKQCVELQMLKKAADVELAAKGKLVVEAEQAIRLLTAGDAAETQI